MPMTGRQLQAFVHEKTPRTLGEVEHMFRALRQSGRIPSGARGRNAPAMTPQAAATALLAVCHAGAVNEVIASCSAVYASRRDGDGLLLPDAIAHYLESQEEPRITCVRLLLNSRYAEVELADGTNEAYSPSQRDFFANRVREFVEIPGSVLNDLAEALK